MVISSKVHQHPALWSVGAGITAALVLSACGAGGPEDPPALSELEDSVMETARDAESVTIDVDGEYWAAVMDDDPMFTGAESDPETDGLTMHTSGDGELLQMDMTMMGVSMDIRMISGTMYMNAESVVDLLVMGAGMEGEDVNEFIDVEGFRADVAGRWITDDTVISEEDLEDFSLQSIFDEWGADDEGLSGTFGDEGELQERDGESVWVYADETEELVVRADEENPYIVSATAEMDGELVSVDFSNWNDAPLPEAPSAEETIEEDELQEILYTHLAGF